METTNLPPMPDPSAQQPETGNSNQGHKKALLQKLMSNLLGKPGRSMHEIIDGVKQAIGAYKNYAKEWDTLNGVVAPGGTSAPVGPTSGGNNKIQDIMAQIQAQKAKAPMTPMPQMQTPPQGQPPFSGAGGPGDMTKSPSLPVGGFGQINPSVLAPTTGDGPGSNLNNKSSIGLFSGSDLIKMPPPMKTQPVDPGFNMPKPTLPTKPFQPLPDYPTKPLPTKPFQPLPDYPTKPIYNPIMPSPIQQPKPGMPIGYYPTKPGVGEDLTKKGIDSKTKSPIDWSGAPQGTPAPTQQLPQGAIGWFWYNGAWQPNYQHYPMANDLIAGQPQTSTFNRPAPVSNLGIHGF